MASSSSARCGSWRSGLAPAAAATLSSQKVLQLLRPRSVAGTAPAALVAATLRRPLRHRWRRKRRCRRRGSRSDLSRKQQQPQQVRRRRKQRVGSRRQLRRSRRCGRRLERGNRRGCERRAAVQRVRTRRTSSYPVFIFFIESMTTSFTIFNIVIKL